MLDPIASAGEETRLLQLPEDVWEHAPREYVELTEKDLQKSWKVNRLLKHVPVAEDEFLQGATKQVVRKALDLLRNSNHREYCEAVTSWGKDIRGDIPIPVCWHNNSFDPWSEEVTVNQRFARERLLAAKLSPLYKAFIDSSKVLQREAKRAFHLAQNVFPEGYIQKLAPASHYRFGDDGEVYAEVPVYTCSALQVHEDVRKRLVERFRRKAREEQDIQPNGVVFDIVDPSLHSYLLSPAERKWFREGLSHKVERRSLPLDYQEGIELTRSEDSEYNHIPEWAESNEYETLLERVHEMDDLRGAFSWVPTVVQCQLEPETGVTSARILGTIPGLPDRQFCSQLYSDLEHVVGAMVPLFAPLLSEQDLGSLQVVFKVQEYVIPPNATYSGRWHTEGFGERILAAGVYYLDVDREATGGDLSFVNEHIPAQDYSVAFTGDYFPDGIFPRDRPVQSLWRFPASQKASTAAETIETPVKTGTAVSFMNSVPHRFKSICNDTEDIQRRLFLNVFIVNPSNPLPWYSSILPPRDQLLSTLAKKRVPAEVRHRILEFVGEVAFPSGLPSRLQLKSFLVQKGISGDLQQRILDYVGGFGTASQVHHAVLRDSAREAMTRARARFGYEHFGNNGNLFFRHGVPSSRWKLASSSSSTSLKKKVNSSSSAIGWVESSLKGLWHFFS